MKWRNRRRSSNIDDRRGKRMTARRAGGGGIGLVVMVLVAMYFGVDPSIILQQGGGLGGLTGGGAPQTETRQPTAAENEMAEMTAVVLADTEEVWHKLFSQSGLDYEEPRLVLFSGAVNSACGFAQAAMGPFYCPGDNQVYIDLSFFDDLHKRHGAPGDFAQAYVIAHEVGHHVQNLLGTSGKVQAAKRRVSEKEANALSVRLELQADCYAGAWAWHTQQKHAFLESGDVAEALQAATAIGDDRLQKQARGYVSPDSFTHGSSEQRVRWFRKGLETGSVKECDTFAADSL